MPKAAYGAIKQADPKLLIASGGLAPAVDNGRDMAPLTFAIRLNSGMEAHCDGAKQIWITEVGAPTGTDRRAVTEAVQAETIRITTSVAQSTAWLGPVYIYSISDAGPNIADLEQNFGVYRYDGTPKLAQRVTRQFAGLP